MVTREDAFWQRQQHAPLYEALVSHSRGRRHSFHVPGHKYGASFDQAGSGHYHSLLSLDLTEISGMDDLHQPQGVIALAQQLAAEAFGADETKFLIGGSTVGNMALIMSVCKPGEKILVQRNCHKSVYNGIILAQAIPVFIIPAVDPSTGVAAGARREDVERVLHAHPDAKAVFLTNPTYYGMGIDLAKMAAAVHRFGIPLLIDEAHGAHYGFHPDVPLSAMLCGADAAVQSTHKMATSMTMTSMLHIQGERINRERLYRALAMLQSSSPSYPLMASLDLARRHIVLAGRKELERALPTVEWLRDKIGTIPWLSTPALTDGAVYTTLDPLKLLLCLHTAELSGYQLQAILEANGVYPELAEPTHVLLAASTGTSANDVEQVWNTIESIVLETGHRHNHEKMYPSVLASSFLREQALPMHEAVNRTCRSVALEQAAGKVCAEMVIPYPPGIPLLVPGERIDTEVVSLLRELRSSGTRFHGVNDASLQEIDIIA